MVKRYKVLVGGEWIVDERPGIEVTLAASSLTTFQRSVSLTCPAVKTSGVVLAGRDQFVCNGRDDKYINGVH